MKWPVKIDWHMEFITRCRKQTVRHNFLQLPDNTHIDRGESKQLICRKLVIFVPPQTRVSRLIQSIAVRPSHFHIAQKWNFITCFINSEFKYFSAYLSCGMICISLYSADGAASTNDHLSSFHAVWSALPWIECAIASEIEQNMLAEHNSFPAHISVSHISM